MLALGVEGIKADDGEGYYLPPDVRFADGSTGAEAPGARGCATGVRCSARSTPCTRARACVFGRPGWTGHQGLGITWGGDQASDFWSLRSLVTATLSAAASGFSNWSHDVGGYLGQRLIDRCPKELLLRWVQFGCFTPLFQAHARFEQEAWTYDAETLALYRAYLVLHERLVPYVRAAAATAARTGLPVMRPLASPTRATRAGGRWPTPTATARRCGWRRCSRTARASARSTSPRATGSTCGRAPRWPAAGRWWRRPRSAASRPGSGAARSSSRCPPSTWPRGLGDVPERERPLEATLWGEPPCGRAQARLADGTVLRWRAGELTVTPERPVTLRHAGPGSSTLAPAPGRPGATTERRP